MSASGTEWLALADHELVEAPPSADQTDAQPLSTAERRGIEKLKRGAPDWTILDRAHEPFAFRSGKKMPAFRPPGQPGENHEFELLAAPPQQLDWRQRAHIGVPLDQGGCNCCSAFAIAAIMTDLATIHAGSARAPLSPGHLHWCVGGADCGTPLAPDALATATTQHLVALLRAGDFPYNPAACPTAQGVARLASFRSLFTANDAVQALQAGPILGVMDLYDDFWSHYGGGVYRRASNTYLNTHSIEIIGYDGLQNCWFVKNSEGQRWGEGGGFGRIAFGECRIFTTGGHGGLALQLA